MEIRQLRYFLATIRRGSVKQAAADHFVTQPAVSVQLKQLETELGAKLCERRGRRMIATQAGAALLTEVEDILKRIDDLPNVVAGFHKLERGELRMGTIDAASVYVLPALFRSFRTRYPGVDIQVEVADSHGLLEDLESNAIELAIVTLPVRGHDLEVVPFFEDTMTLVAHPKHPLIAESIRGKRALAQVADAGLITYPSQSTTRHLIERVFIENGLDFRPAMEMSSPEAIKRLAESGLGAAVLPTKVVAAEVRRGTLRAVPTGRYKFARMLGIVHRGEESLSQPARIFLTMLLDKHSGTERTL